MAVEFLPALGARLKAPPAESQASEASQVTTWESWWLWGQKKAKDQVISTLVSQCTEARLRTAIAEDFFQAVLALAAMVLFDQYSGMWLLNFVVSGAKDRHRPVPPISATVRRDLR